MKIYVYFLTFLLTFAPVYANAVLPVVAVAGSTAGRFVITKGGESFLRTLAPSSLAKIGKNVVGICAKNPAALLACGVITSAIKGDGWTIKIENETTNNDVDVEIYRNIEDKCFIDFYLQEFSSSTNTTEYDVSSYSAYLVNKSNLNNPYKYNYTVNTQEPYSQISDIKETFRSQGITNTNYVKYPNPIRFPLKATASNGWTSTEYKGADFYYRCLQVSHKTYMEDSHINNYFTKNVSDDDITNIYNYDYSQHQNIKINNDIEYGDTINNYKNDIDINNTDKKVTQNVVDKAKSKDSDYDPDKINDENCDKDDAGAYDKCGSDRDEDDDTASAPASTPTSTDPPKDDDDDEPPIECNSNGFYKKVCDWMDWTQEDPTKPTDEKPPIKDIEAQNSNKIDMAGSCPAPYQINFSVYGYPLNNSISYQPLCDALEILNPIFVGAGALSGMFILMGYSRPNSTGVND